MAKGFWGNASGPGAKMYAYVEMRTTAQEEGRAWVQFKRSCYGGQYVSNINRFSKVYRVMIQADPKYRLDPEYEEDKQFPRVHFQSVSCPV